MAIERCRGHHGLTITARRCSNVMDQGDEDGFPFDADPLARKWNLWGYIDARDGAQAVRRSLEAEFKGFEAFIIANADTVMSRAYNPRLAQAFPGLPGTVQESPTGPRRSTAKTQPPTGHVAHL